ncbi:MAG TPA: 50S ribosomal protein L3 [bacterium]|jgi:large subunit ribosomal protein L3|nr:50S ribosomal protein L3 [bacterium]
MEKLTGKKLNMTQVFDDNGKVTPVTIVLCNSDVSSEIENKSVVIVGKSKGKGFTGVMKKWGFHGGPATRGQGIKGRTPGSIGSQTPGRVLKGKKMAGRAGNERISIKGLRIVKVLPELKQVMISGPVPGARNSKIEIKFIEDKS